MDKKLLATGTAFTLLFTTISASTFGYAKKGDVNTEVVSVNPTEGQIINKIIPERGSSSSTIINNREGFRGYKGQGTIYLTTNGVESAKVYVNGKSIDLNNQLDGSNGKTIKVDVSSLTVNGQNTLQISNIKPAGATIEVDIDYPTLIIGDPSTVGIDLQVFETIDSILECEIKAGGIPGGQLLVAKDGVIIKNQSYGNVKAYDNNGIVENKVPVTNETLYDLASNTKMYSANYAIQKLVSEGKLNVDDTIDSIIDGFSQYDSQKSQLTIKNLLNHTGGFIPDPQYHNESYLHPTKVDGKEVNLLDKDNNGINDVFTQEPSKILEMIEKTPLEYIPGTKNVYSDVDYMLLGIIVEKISGKTFDEYCNENIFTPLELKNTTFNPLKNGFNKEAIAATEIFGNTREGNIDFTNIRTETVQGEVHDEKAYYAMGGVSGHAGLFSNATELAKLMQVMLNGGGYGGVKLFDQKTIDAFVAPSKTNDTYGLGWRRQGDNGYAWSFGEQAPDSTIGHTGWTGTSTSIDSENDLLIVWLTNTKNTPIADANKNLNRMEGDAFQFDAAGTLSTLVYEGLIGTSSEALDESLLQLSLDRTAFLVNSIEENSNCTEADYKAAIALVEVLVSKAETYKGKDKEVISNRARVAFNALPDHELKVELGKRVDRLKK